MTPFAAIEGTATPLPLSNVDTDVVIRIEHLARSPKAELGRWAFAPLRFDAQGAPRPDCVFNQAPWIGAPILVAGANFGCGSSREQAVWALQSLGVRCVIAPSFGDIFRNNCFENGVLPVQLPAEAVDRLLALLEQERSFGRTVTMRVDLQARTLQWPGPQPGAWEVLGFDTDARRREQLLLGLDAIGTTLRQREAIAAWQQADRTQRPWIWLTSPGPG